MNNTRFFDVSSDCQTALADRTFRLTAERLVLKCGIRSDLKGCELLIDAVILFGTETCASLCEIYHALGARRGIKSKSVMREIAYALNQAPDIVARFSALVGAALCKRHIHSALVIACLGKIFRRPSLAVYA